MKAASVSEIKSELKEVSPAQLVDICLRLARYKKENKELLTFLLFEAHDLPSYLKSVKEEIDAGFADINTSNLYFAKKSLRKILRVTNKFSKYTGSKQAEVELLIYFCMQLKESKIPVHKSAQLTNLYQGQIKKIKAAVATLHEDLQYDYLSELKKLE